MISYLRRQPFYKRRIEIHSMPNLSIGQTIMVLKPFASSDGPFQQIKWQYEQSKRLLHVKPKLRTARYLQLFLNTAYFNINVIRLTGETDVLVGRT